MVVVKKIEELDNAWTISVEAHHDGRYTFNGVGTLSVDAMVALRDALDRFYIPNRSMEG